MPEGKIRVGNGGLTTAYIYEGENLALEYPDGQTLPIPRNKVHMCLVAAITEEGEDCHILLPKTPVTRLDIVICEEEGD